MPMQNQRDYDELPSHIKKGIKVYFVDDYEQVFEIAFKKT